MSELEKNVPEETVVNEGAAVEEQPETEESTMHADAALEETSAQEEETSVPEKAEPEEAVVSEKETTEQEELEKEKQRKKQKKETAVEKKRSAMVADSQYLRYIAEMRKADSELAMAKAESAELVMQMDRFKRHYVEYEKHIASLVQEIDTNHARQMKKLIALSGEIKNNSASLENRIDGEIERLTAELAKKLDEDVKESCEQELVKVEEATKILSDYSEKVKQECTNFAKKERLKFILLLLSGIFSPIVLILMVLSMCNII